MAEIAGKNVEQTEDGYLINPSDWTKEIAVEIAKQEGIELSDAHWKVIDFVQSDFKAKGVLPSIRRLKKAGGIDTKEFYALFPDGPLKKAARIAGLSKPASCV